MCFHKPKIPVTTLNKLKFCIWNIHGCKSRQLGNKLQNEMFLNIQNDVDLIGLTETHIHEGTLEHLSIPGFQLKSYKNQKKNLKSNTAPGALLFL